MSTGPQCIADNRDNSRVMRWSVRADFERAHSQIWVKVSLLVAADLSAGSGLSLASIVRVDITVTVRLQVGTAGLTG